MINLIKVISYFSIFKYPLTADEIFYFSNKKEKDKVLEELNVLKEKGVIQESEGFYSETNNDELIARRKKGNEEANLIMPKAWEISKLISKFPYISSVCISGSLSKGYFEDKSDIDFFIITNKNRLWIARTLLILYKKIFLLNSKKYFCVNYFMSSGHLEIEEQNRFTATEIVTLIPTYGKDMFHDFVRNNQWVYDYYPNFKIDSENTKNISKNFFSNSIEKVLNKKLGNKLERFFMKITIKKWNNKFNHLSKEDFEIAFKSSENVSKHHPSNFQKKVLNLLNEKYENIEKKYYIKLEPENV
ncbi:nucleotidyltransferase domain-containing protein [Tenacibaculum sp. SZ-18]|uniref:nucleotidyltransferase domain-containing protein n=1 Tax=Tenacibaculum sp. SZ-18 TaxID=754423 RepID=UPI001E3C41D8|nr:nucleotidyltransferase domain-containing protein [Tenacibaculum sp. SZ-18]